ncbi:hypothetical protein MHBO_004625, partial [Bonamia ostreae]
MISDGTLLTYEAFYFDQNKSLNGQSYYPLRLSRIKNEYVSPYKQQSDKTPNFLTSLKNKIGNLRYFYRFKNICGHPGIFVAGDNPQFMFEIRGKLKFFPLKPKKRIWYFAEMDNNRFLLADGNLKICSISAFIDFSCDIPFRRVPIRQSVSKIMFHPETSAYVVSCFKAKEV